LQRAESVLAIANGVAVCTLPFGVQWVPLSSVFVLISAAFMLIASIILVRMPAPAIAGMLRGRLRPRGSSAAAVDKQLRKVT